MANDQGMFELPEGDGTKGFSDKERLKKGFPDSPVFNETVSRSTQTNLFKDLLGSVQTENVDFPNVDMDYGDAPSITVSDFESANKLAKSSPSTGLPATPFVPNLASPGEVNGVTNLDYTSITEAVPSVINDTSPKPFGSGEGTDLDPSTSATSIGGQDFKALVKGSSS